MAALLRRARVLAVLVAVGCFSPDAGHRMQFDLARERTGSTLVEQHSYFLWGLVPTAKIDVLKKCPLGAVAIEEGTPAAAHLSSLFTLGLWSRRSTTYYCRADAEPPTAIR